MSQIKTCHNAICSSSVMTFLDNFTEHGGKNLSKDAKLQQLLTAFEGVKYLEGTILYEQGDTEADCMHIIAEGECSISIDGQDLPDPYGTMTPGSIIGELALLYDSARTATVTCKTDVYAYRLDVKSFKTFLSSNSSDEEILKAELKKIDSVLDKLSGVKTRYGGEIIRPFKPSRSWLWGRWNGTILQHAWKAALFNSLITLGLTFFVRALCMMEVTWKLGMLPDTTNSFILHLLGVNRLWFYLMSLTTFILTFFLSQAYRLWREMYTVARVVQGRLQDIGFIVATSAKRTEEGDYTAESEALIDDVAMYTRLWHLFLWAKQSQSYSILLTNRGFSRMLSRGYLTQKQYNTMKRLNVNAKPQNACLAWVMTRCMQGIDQGTLTGDIAVRQVLMNHVCELRSTSACIGDKLAGRMPLAYAHIVQVLVDAFLFLSPVALYCELGAWSAPAVGLMTLFYSGLLDLAKILLDPLNNDNFYNDSVNMDVGVLIRESNAGSTTWKYGAEVLPF